MAFLLDDFVKRKERKKTNNKELSTIAAKTVVKICFNVFNLNKKS